MIPPIANNFVAGKSPEQAAQRALELNQSGITGIVNLLGEHYEKSTPANEDTQSYICLLEILDETDADACISVKPSQIGLDIGAETFEENIRAIVRKAMELGTFVWIDMEDVQTTDDTLDVFESLTRENDGGVGVCIQANLKRTEDDLARLASLPGKVRLVKGAYDEHPSQAYKDKSVVDAQYKRNLEYMFEHFDGGVAVGSHDVEMVEHAKSLHEKWGTDFEIQMLMGVREELQYDLADEYEVYQYLPYGDKWMSYFYRRVRERKENLVFAMRAVVNSI